MSKKRLSRAPPGTASKFHLVLGECLCDARECRRTAGALPEIGQPVLRRISSVNRSSALIAQLRSTGPYSISVWSTGPGSRTTALVNRPSAFWVQCRSTGPATIYVYKRVYVYTYIRVYIYGYTNAPSI